MLGGNQMTQSENTDAAESDADAESDQQDDSEKNAPIETMSPYTIGNSLPSLALDETWAGRVHGGWPTLDIADFKGQIAELADGNALSLCDSAGKRIGFGIVDRANAVVRALPSIPKDEWNADFFARHVDRAFEMRRRMRLAGPNAAYRLINSEGDGLAGFLVDVLAQYAIVYTYSAAYERYADWLGEAVAKKLGSAGVLHKVRPRGEPPTGRLPYRLVHGDEPPKTLAVEERGLQYEVHPVGGLNPGLFCDMRDVRSAIARLARGLRVLNTFAYTGSLSVVAAANNAKSVTTVDFASGVLHWAKANFELNGLDPAAPQYRFVKADVIDFLKHERRKDRGYNLVILDPPTATNVPGKRWFLKSDYARLIGHALEVLDRFGFLLVAANSLETRPEGIERQIKEAARDHHRRLRLLESFGPPPDFPSQVIHPASRHLKCFLLQADV